MITESLNDPNTKVIENDYMGMAKDMRAMKRRFYDYKNNGHFRFILDPLDERFLDSICEFEDYCLDQPVRITGDLIKDQIRSFNCYV